MSTRRAIDVQGSRDTGETGRGDYVREVARKRAVSDTDLG